MGGGDTRLLPRGGVVVVMLVVSRGGCMVAGGGEVDEAAWREGVAAAKVAVFVPAASVVAGEGVAAAMEVHGGEGVWGSDRSGDGDNIWFRPERSSENFSDGGGMVAGGGWPAGRVARYFWERERYIVLDEEIALKLQAEIDEKERIARAKEEKIDEANISLTKEWDDIQAKIEADHELAQRLQAEEQEELTDLVEGSLKRAGEKLEQENTKKQKVDEDKDTTKLQSLMKVILDEEEVAIDVVTLATKPPTIVDWKIHKEGRKSYY
ncbi:hypothetical protein Tco_0887020 [Tanacetum coccineum]